MIADGVNQAFSSGMLHIVQRMLQRLVSRTVMRPGLDGFEALRRIRQKSRLPTLMLAARGDETDWIVGLEIGADD